MATMNVRISRHASSGLRQSQSGAAQSPAGAAGVVDAQGRPGLGGARHRKVVLEDQVRPKLVAVISSPSPMMIVIGS
jgi:hypothetical protein